MQKGRAMRMKNLPTNTWMVVDVAYNSWNVVSTHGSQGDAETERDRRNEGLARRRYSACLAAEPVMHQPIRQSCD
jgi:hypothetical protein